MKTVLVVDSDLGFIAFLCQTLTSAGFCAVPAVTAQRAFALIQELKLSQVDLVVANLALPGTSELIETLRPKPRNVIAIEDVRLRVIGTSGTAGTLKKPSGFEPVSGRKWLRIVRRALGEEEKLKTPRRNSTV